MGKRWEIGEDERESGGEMERWEKEWGRWEMGERARREREDIGFTFSRQQRRRCITCIMESLTTIYVVPLKTKQQKKDMMVF
jgi:hypothetical protein